MVAFVRRVLVGVARRVIAALAPSPSLQTSPSSSQSSAPALAPARFAEVLDPRFLLDDPMIRRPLEEADARLNDTPSSARPALFDRTPLDAFALLSAGEYEGLPNIRAWLPSMPPIERQTGSVGTSGAWALLQAAAFVRAAVSAYEATGADLKAARVLDYGVCWARLSRLFYKYVPVEQLHGVDAWPASLDMAREAGFRGALALVDPTPRALPFPAPFDLVFAFSILTHLSATASDAVARTVRAGLRPGGLFVFTVRPANFWETLGDAGAAHRQEVEKTGLGFTPEKWALEAGNLDYGNTTITLDYMKAHWPGFELVGVELLPTDAYQICVILKAV